MSKGARNETPAVSGVNEGGKDVERRGVEDVNGLAGVHDVDVLAGVNDVGRVLVGGHRALRRRRPSCAV